MRSSTLISAALFCLLSAAPQVEAQDSALDKFFTEFAEDWVRGDPNSAIRSRYFSGAEQARLERQLTPLTDAWQRERIALARQGLARLSQLSSDRVDANQRLSVDVMRWQLETLVAREPYIDYDFPLQQFNGANVNLVNELTVAHPIAVVQDAESYVARLATVAARMGEAVAMNSRRAELGIMPPRFIVEATMTQMRRFTSVDPAENPFVQTLAQKMQGIDEIAAQQRLDFTVQATRVVETEIYPAWENAISLLESQLPETTSDAGLWRFADGADYYAYQLRRFTTTELTADEIHEIGLAEVARLETEMDRLLQQIGLVDGTVAERVELLQARLSRPATDTTRAQIMVDIDAMIRDAEERAEALFDLTPVTPVIAQAYPEFRWSSAAASYTPPPLDGSRPGIFQMPLRPSRLTDFSLRTLVYHETVPGHHFHVALFTENPELPRFRQARIYGGISAITEGWALYAERLAAESNWYEGDIEGLIGQLDSALFRARRLVVDTGLHAKRWTRQQAIDYGIEPSEVDRYVVMPGQACSYMIGQLKFVELRAMARNELGDAFDIKQFHNLVLSIGPVPLTILEREVEAYVAALR